MKKFNFKILQWNCRSIKNKLDLLHVANEYDIILLVETWLEEFDHFNLKGYDIVRFDRDYNKGGGIAICIKKGIIFYKINLTFNNSSLEVGSVSINSNQGIILLTVCYRPPKTNNNISKSEWLNFMDAVNSFDANHFIVAGDFNAHHYLWGSSKLCSNGNIIADNLDYENFILLNKKSFTHLTISNSEISYSNIDLTFVSPGLASMSEWYVLDDRWGSNHFPIVLEINARPIYKQKLDYKYNHKIINWEIFYKQLDENKNYFNSLEFVNMDSIQI